MNLHDRKLVAYAKDEVSTTGAMEGYAAGVKLFDDAAAEMPISEGSNQSKGIVLICILMKTLTIQTKTLTRPHRLLQP